MRSLFTSRGHSLKNFKFSHKQLLLFAVIFAAIGGYIIYKSLAATPSNANIWVDLDGGTCARSATPAAYNTATACGTISAAWTAAQPGDLILVKGGTYSSGFSASGAKTSTVTIEAASGENPWFAGDGSLNNVTNMTVSDDRNVLSQGLTMGRESISGSSANIHLNNVDAWCQNQAPWQITTGVNGSQCSAHIIISGVDGFYMNGGFIGPNASCFTAPCSNSGDTAAKVTACSTNAACNNINFTGVHFHDSITLDSAVHNEMVKLDQGQNITFKNNIFTNCTGCNSAVIFFGESGTLPTADFATFIGNSIGPAKAGGKGIHYAYNVPVGHEPTLTFKNNTVSGSIDVCGADINNDPCGPGPNSVIAGTNVNFIANTSWRQAFEGCSVGHFQNNLWFTDVATTNVATCTGDNPGVQGANLSTWFTNPNGEDFHLIAGSPLIDKGGNTCAGTTDIDGVARPVGGTCDVGAYELNGANIFVATTGSDTGANCKRFTTITTFPGGTVCASINKAFQIAQGGDIIEVENGTYAGQTIASASKTSSVFIRAATPSQVLLTGGLSIDSDHVHISGVISAGSGETRNSLDVCGTDCGVQFTDVLIDGFQGKSAFIRNSNVTVQNSEFGGADACKNLAIEDSFRFWGGSGVNVTPTNDKIINSRIHDWSGEGDGSCNGTVTPTPHLDCMQTQGGVNITVSGDLFYNCPSDNIQAAPFGTGNTESNWTVENNYLGPTECCNTTAVQIQGAAGQDCHTLVIRYNIMSSGNNLGNCGSGSLAVVQDSNVYINGISACGNFAGAYNIFPVSGGTTCGTNLKRCTPTFVTSLPALGGGQPDIHLSNTDTCAIDAGDPANFPGVDFDGDARPQGSAPDAGPDEFSLASGTATTQSTPAQGDLNSDGHITITDLSILLSHYGQAATASQGDINNDGVCSVVDLSILLSHYGT